MEVFGIHGYQAARTGTGSQYLIYQGTAEKLEHGEPFKAVSALQLSPDEIGEEIVGNGKVFWSIEREGAGWILIQQAFRGNTADATVTIDSADGPLLDGSYLPEV
jgi:hypothetical protein